MTKAKSVSVFCALALLTVFFAAGTHKSANAVAQSDDKLVYADFDTIKDNRPVSARGGYVQIFAGSENPGNPARFASGPSAGSRASNRALTPAAVMSPANS